MDFASFKEFEVPTSSPFVSDKSSTAISISPLLVQIVRSALEIPLSPMTPKRRTTIAAIALQKNLSLSIVENMMEIYCSREIILRFGFSENLLSPAGKRRKNGLPHGHIKRPLNSFMLYRRVQTYLFHASMKYHHTPFISKLNKVNHQAISIVIGQLWCTERQLVRDEFFKLSQQESLLHKELHPDYKFSPRKRQQKSKIGSVESRYLPIMPRPSPGTVELNASNTSIEISDNRVINGTISSLKAIDAVHDPLTTFYDVITLPSAMLEEDVDKDYGNRFNIIQSNESFEDTKKEALDFGVFRASLSSTNVCFPSTLGDQLCAVYDTLRIDSVATFEGFDLGGVQWVEQNDQ
ncbi:hypothetical protein V1514DRAFT_342579 [Lipomyces japonicus]|uniref:uncharacterized protein n=1 Tax=Lipomyces japonicus TaxID=56871 RepID=UPI0034CE21FB